MKIVEDVCGNKWLVEIPDKSEIVQIGSINYFYRTSENGVALILQNRECISIDITYDEFVDVLFEATITITFTSEKVKEENI